MRGRDLTTLLKDEGNDVGKTDRLEQFEDGRNDRVDCP